MITHNIYVIFRYRATVPSWVDSYLAASSFLETTNFLTNPNVLEIVSVWSNFKHLRLFEMEPILSKTGAYDLKIFKSMMTSRIEKAHEKLLTT